jgi:hypothetical protein
MRDGPDEVVAGDDRFEGLVDLDAAESYAGELGRRGRAIDPDGHGGDLQGLKALPEQCRV